MPRCGWRPRQRGGRNGRASSPNACESRRRRRHSSHESCTSPARPPAPSSRSRSVPRHGMPPCRNSTHGKSSRCPSCAGHQVAGRERASAGGASALLRAALVDVRGALRAPGVGAGARRGRARSAPAGCTAGSAASAGTARPGRPALSPSGHHRRRQQLLDLRADAWRARRPAAAAPRPARRARCGQSSSPSTSVVISGSSTVAPTP